MDDRQDRLDPATLFLQPAPLEIDVGAGKGMFLSSAAAEKPDRNFLGIEIRQKYARFAAARAARRQLDNVRVLHGDALRFFSESLGNDSVAAVHVYFPDPWWKKRHRKRRVMSGPFVKDVERTLVPGGSLHFWTDVAEYYETTLELIGAATRLQGPLAVAERAAAHDLDYRTNFERRTRLDDQRVFRAEFRKLPRH